MTTSTTTPALQIAKTTGLDVFHPEMGEKRAADAVIDASLSHYGKHYFIKTAPHIMLKGRGIKHLNTLTAEQLTPQAQHKVGWHEYKVTIAAFEALCAAHKVSVEQLLD